MKNLFLAFLFFTGTTTALAQMEKVDDHQEAVQDKIEQEPQPPAQVTLERSARIEAQREENEKADKRAAKKLAKKQAKQTAVTPTPLKK